MFPSLRALCFLVLATFVCGFARANDTLVHARHAQALLGSAVWSTVIALENDAPRSRYPEHLHALVFELSGVLWFYTSIDGTQSFSLHRGRLAEEKADFGPLLRDIEPGFRSWRSLPRSWETTPEALSAPLPNGCFVESVATWVSRVAAGEQLAAPQLLSFYVDTPRGRLGHTVLTYETSKGVAVIDPATGRTSTFPAAWRSDAIRLARAVRGADVARARWLALELGDAPMDVTRIAGEAPGRDDDAEVPQSVG